MTQRGGAERVVLSMLRAFPDAPLYAALYDPRGTFPAFADARPRTLALDRVPLLRRSHRLALAMLAPAFSRLEVDYEVVLCSSSGWAHGVRTRGRKIVYCHTPARWLYQPHRYLRDSGLTSRTALAALRPYLLRWDRRAAASAHRYLANSKAVQARIRDLYGIEADVLPPPHAIDPHAPAHAPAKLEPGFVLCVSRLLPYKNVDAVVEAFSELPHRLVVVGTGPEDARLRRIASGNVRFLGSASDEELRWLYASCAGLVAASHEDYGLTPLEAAAFGKPSAVLRWGGFLDTVLDGVTGVFFDRPEPAAIGRSVEELVAASWEADALAVHAERFSEKRFVERLRTIVAEEAGRRR